MTFANMLTVFRILMLIPFVGLFYIDKTWANWTALVLYWIACLTDYFDGMVARKTNQVSLLGEFLDPVADKLLITTTLLILAGTDRLNGLSLIPAIIIMCRELFISGLREYLSAENIQVPVSILAKWKTAVQMVSLSCLIVNNINSFVFGIHELGIIGLWVSAALALITGWEYWRKSYSYFLTH